MQELNCPICHAPSGGGHHVGDSTVIMCPECGNYRLAGTALTLLQNGTLQRPDRAWFRDLVNRRRGDADEYPIITQYDLG